MFKRNLAPHTTFIILLLSFSFVSLRGQGGTPDAPALPPNSALPSLSPPSRPVLDTHSRTLRSGDLELVQSDQEFGGFELRVAGQSMALGLDHPQLAWLDKDTVRWLDLANAPNSKLRVRGGHKELEVLYSFADTWGAKWELVQRFSVSGKSGVIDIQTTAQVDQDRALAFLPMLVVFPGADSFGTNKGQGLFAGLEYLDNEPSSSEADVIGPAAKREVPDSVKITLPLMAIQNGESYVALTWQPEARFGALFDSPDRTFNSGAHVMGLLFPGSEGQNRAEGNLLPRRAGLLRAHEPLVLHAALLGGHGKTVVPAVRQYVMLRGLPGVGRPSRAHALNTNNLPIPSEQSYVSLAAGGWLDSKIREGTLFRHAVFPDFPAVHPADAAVWMQWLAGRTAEPELKQRLETTARSELQEIPAESWNSSGIGHNRNQAAALVFGHALENAQHAEAEARSILGGFEPDFSIRYRPRAGGTDLSRTHWTNEANGLTASRVYELLEAAAFSGKADLIHAAIERLDAMDKFRNGVPRGAQTWEVPLHTPDILASANLVHAYTLGYELSGRPEYLEQARYWAWTGVPFVYLTPPVNDEPVGLYATIAVYGATQWKAPVWIGLPVQWCGLVYARSLYLLSRCDPQGPWKTLADGITVSGIAQSWPASDPARQGLLPDSFVLKPPHRNGPAINPGTLEACATELFGQPACDFHCFGQNGVRVYAPGKIDDVRESPGRLRFRVAGWPRQPYYVLANGLTAPPEVRVNAQRVPLGEQCQFSEPNGVLVLKVQGETQVELLQGKAR